MECLPSICGGKIKKKLVILIRSSELASKNGKKDKIKKEKERKREKRKK